ncbi:MAG: DOMON domain-containing protein [Candidatus Bipolaricaulota bacterium]
MWSVSKEGLILLGIVGALAVIGLAIWLFSPGPPEDVAFDESNAVAEDVAASATASEPPPAAASVPPLAADPEPSSVPASAMATPPLTPAIDGVIVEGEYPHQTESTGFEIYWSNDARVLRVGLVSPGTGYLAIGFAPEARMQGANYILGAVIDGRAVVRDDYGTGPVSHAADTALGGRDDVWTFAGTEADGHTILEFMIPLDSGDEMDTQLVPNTSVEVLIAYHVTDDDFVAWHSRRGRGFLMLDPG